jgi:hypothetical protein
VQIRQVSWFLLYTYISIKLLCLSYIWSKRSTDFKELSGCSVPLKTNYCVPNRQMFILFRLNKQRFPTLRFYFQGWFFFSYLTDFSYFSVKKKFWKLQDTVRTGKNSSESVGRNLLKFWYLLQWIYSNTLPKK